MGQIIYFPTFYIPSQDELDHFYFLQTATNNAVKEIIESEPSKYWQVARIRDLINKRRENFTLIKNEGFQE